jgi:uncharacterized protein YdbL (DUF1318 family)
MKTTLKTLTIVFSLMAAFLVAPASLRAADAPDEAALQKRLKERYPKIQQLKSQGVIGETDAGYVDFVDKKDSKSASLVDDENADRKAAYKLIADKEGITVDVVAKRAGKRNFDRAKAGEWLKEGGKWRKKEASKPAR